eukprot:1853996-Pyramimonas_sp.AAC.1
MKSVVRWRGHLVWGVRSAGELGGSRRAAVRIRCTYSVRRSSLYPLKGTPKAMHQSSSVMSVLPFRCSFEGSMLVSPTPGSLPRRLLETQSMW